jgi:predicted phosphohydrolase
MVFSFDIISDLHCDAKNSGINWDGFATSPFCIVTGDVARNRQSLIKTLSRVADSYPGGVFYIDGNDEHRDYYSDVVDSYQDLSQSLKKINNLVYLHDNIVVIDGVAIVAVNGWWTYDFNPEVDVAATFEWFDEYANTTRMQSNNLVKLAYADAAYLVNSVKRLQKHPSVKKIVIVSHTLPAPWLASHDIDLVNTFRFNCLGNQYLQLALEEDTEHKIDTWVFGHYHKPVDQVRDGIRYVSNPRGRPNTPWSQNPYYPRRIDIEI